MPILFEAEASWLWHIRSRHSLQHSISVLKTGSECPQRQQRPGRRPDAVEFACDRLSQVTTLRVEMLKSIVNRFVVLDSFKVDGNRLRMRFVPDFLDIQDTDPVLWIQVDLTESTDEAGKELASIRGYLVDDIETDESTLLVSIESSELPIEFSGSVAWSFEEYSLSDYRKAIQRLNQFASEQTREVVSLRRRLKGARQFLDQTVARLERKRNLSRIDNTVYTKQLELLKRVRRRFEDGTP